MSLQNLRDALSEVDRQIIQLVAERQRIVSDIGRDKLSRGSATRDYAREKDVVDRGRGQAAELGIDPDLAESILTTLIRASLENQERDRVIAEGKADLYPRLGPTSEWDTAAAQCVVEQAGGFVTDTHMQPLRYNTKDSLLNPFFLVFGDDSRDWSQYLEGEG